MCLFTDYFCTVVIFVSCANGFVLFIILEAYRAFGGDVRLFTSTNELIEASELQN